MEAADRPLLGAVQTTPHATTTGYVDWRRTIDGLDGVEGKKATPGRRIELRRSVRLDWEVASHVLNDEFPMALHPRARGNPRRSLEADPASHRGAHHVLPVGALCSPREELAGRLLR